MAFRTHWAEAVLHVVRGFVYREFVFVRAGAEPWRAGIFPDFAGRGRRRIAAKRAGDFERYVFAGETRDGFCGLWNCGGCGADDWAVAGRMDYRQFFLEMDFLYQRARGNYFADPDVLLDFGSAVHEAGKRQERIPD